MSDAGASEVADDGCAFGGFGERLSEATASEFFRWFHLEEVDRASRGRGMTIVRFKPAGDAFRALVTLEATVDRDGRIGALELVVARSFIDDPRGGAFAGDIAASFLRAAATAPGDAAAIDGVANELAFPRHLSPPPIMCGPPPALPDPPTPGGAVFRGVRDDCEQRLSRLRLALTNTRPPNGAAGVRMRLERDEPTGGRTTTAPAARWWERFLAALPSRRR